MAAETEPSAPSGLPDNLSFEEALRELEEVVSALETGNVPLEQSLALLQRGMTLASGCDGLLARAEATLEQLVANDNGELETQPLEFEDDLDDDADDE